MFSSIKRIKQKKSSYAALSSQASFFFNPETESYACSNCDKECKNKSHIQLHLYVHTIGKLYQCDHVYTDGLRCTKKTKRPDGIKRHKNETHSDLRSHECHQCLIKFKRNEHLQAHLKNIHSIIKEEPHGDELEKPEEESHLEESIHAAETEEEHEEDTEETSNDSTPMTGQQETLELDPATPSREETLPVSFPSPIKATRYFSLATLEEILLEQ